MNPISKSRLPAGLPKARWPEREFLCALLGALLAAPLPAAVNEPHGLADLSLEELMNVTVTSVSKREQKLSDAASAISVLSNEDIRRSGATTIMEALRLVPGVNVGQVNSAQWAVSARGFNDLFSNKLLVLVDGRAVYNGLFAGVFWDALQVMLDDVDRIEVIRGPGATVWGANAVNGVINVVSRSARDTQGGLLYGGGGDQHEWMGGVRYGGQAGPNTYYRVFASAHTESDSPLANGTPAHDSWTGRHGGFRLDHYPSDTTHLTWQADATEVRLDDGSVREHNLNTLGRWTRQLSDRSSLEVQAYYDRIFRDDLAVAKGHSDTFDLTAQHTFGLGEKHNIIWGGGYRYSDIQLAPTNALIQVRRDRSRLQLFSAFLQDDFQLVPDKLILTTGCKLEHNDYTGWEFQPNLRAVFKPTRESTVWAAWSRAVRTPNAVEGRDMMGIPAGAPFVGPAGGFYLPISVGNARPDSEVLRAYEAGYRIQSSRHVSVELALFYNHYSELIGTRDIRRFVPGVPFGIAEIPSVNLRTGQSYGGEASVTVSPVDRWRLTASYSRLVVLLQGPGGVRDPTSTGSPGYQAMLRTSHDLTRRTSLDVQLRKVAAITRVPAYVTADLRLAYFCTDLIELSLVGQNLLERQHPEQPLLPFIVVAEVPRSVYAKLTWRF